MAARRPTPRRQRATALLGVDQQLAQSEDLLGWTEAVRRFDGRPMRVTGPMRELYASTAPKIVLRKAAQLGGTEWGLNQLFYVADTHFAGRGNGVYFGPTDQSTNDIVQARVAPAIANSPYLSRRRGPGQPDNLGLIGFGQGHTYFRSAGSPSALRSVDADLVVLDEFDDMPAHALAMATHRLDSSANGLLRILGTPTFPGVGIDAQYMAGDRREWHVTCPSCATEQPITYERNVCWSPASVADPGLIANFQCLDCGDDIGEVLRRAWATGDGGRWIATHLQGLYPSYTISALHRGDEERLRAIVRELQSEDVNVLQHAHNQSLGQPYAAEGMQIDAGLLERLIRVGKFSQADLQATGDVVIGVDVGSLMHCWVEGIKNGLPYLIEARTVPEFEDIDALLRRFRPRAVVVDASPELHSAEALKNRFPGQVFLATYVQNHWPANWTTATDPQGHLIADDRQRYRVQADRTAAMDAFVGSLRGRTTPQLGWQPTYGFPTDARQIPALIAQLMAPVRQLQSTPNGGSRAVWQEGSQDDHYFHAGTYAHLARIIAADLPATGSGDWWLPPSDDGSWQHHNVFTGGDFNSVIGGLFGR